LFPPNSISPFTWCSSSLFCLLNKGPLLGIGLTSPFTLTCDSVRPTPKWSQHHLFTFNCDGVRLTSHEWSQSHLLLSVVTVWDQVHGNGFNLTFYSHLWQCEASSTKMVSTLPFTFSCDSVRPTPWEWSQPHLLLLVVTMWDQLHENGFNPTFYSHLWWCETISEGMC